VRPLIERCLAKDPDSGPPPSACSPRWAPSSRQRTGCPNRSSARSNGITRQDPCPPHPVRLLRRSGRLRRPGSSARQRHRSALRRRYLAGKACSWPARTIRRPPPSGRISPPLGDTHPPGSTYRQPPPGGRNRPRRRLLRPLVLAWIIGGLIAAPAAGYAVTTLTGGNTSTPTPSPAGADVHSGGIHSCEHARIHVGEHRRVRIGIRFYIAAVDEGSHLVALGVIQQRPWTPAPARRRWQRSGHGGQLVTPPPPSGKLRIHA